MTTDNPAPDVVEAVAMAIHDAFYTDEDRDAWMSGECPLDHVTIDGDVDLMKAARAAIAAMPVTDDLISCPGVTTTIIPVSERTEYEPAKPSFFEDASAPAAALDAMKAELAAKDAAGQFLLDRLDEFWNEMTDDTAATEFNGHVLPAMERYRTALDKPA